MQTANISTTRTPYLPVPLEKFYRIMEGDLKEVSRFLEFVAITQEANIPIIEIKGASKARLTDAADVEIDENPSKKTVAETLAFDNPSRRSPMAMEFVE